MNMSFYPQLREELFKIGVNILKPTADLSLHPDDLKQFNITFEYEFKKSDIEELSLLIKSHSEKIVFLSLPVNKASKFCQVHEIDNVWARYTEEFKLTSDDLIKRWDVLVY